MKKRAKNLNESNYDKYCEIVERVLAAVSMATVTDIDETLFANWPEGDEHRKWLESASVENIADWAEGIIAVDLAERGSK